MGSTIRRPATWRVRVKFGEPRLIIDGDDKYQEFSVQIGDDAKWMARMLRKAMRRLCPDKESK